MGRIKMSEQLSPQLTAEQASRVIAADIRAYPQSGPDKLGEHLRLFGALLSHEDIEGAWADRYAEIALAGQGKLADLSSRLAGLRPKIEEAKRKLAEPAPLRRFSGPVLFLVPATQPPADTTPKDTDRKAAVSELIRRNQASLAPKPKPKPKPEEEPEPEAEPEPDEEEQEAAQQGQIVASTQIALPITATAAKAVALLNQKHHVIGNYGNKCVVLSWELWEINRNVMIPTFQRFEDFSHRYMNRYVWRQTKTGLDKVPAGAFWLRDPGRITYDSVTFRPNPKTASDKPEVLSGNRLNLWRGFGAFPRKGSWKLMHDHIYNVLGAGDPKAGLYIERWLAYTVQHPEVVGETVLVLQGDEGTGKGTLGRAMLRIFGPHGLPVTQPKHLVGGFSGHLQYCCFLFLDEAFWAGDVQAEGRLKSLITEDTITIEPKYFTPFQVPNLLPDVVQQRLGRSRWSSCSTLCRLQSKRRAHERLRLLLRPSL
jgi:hypothetical protein